MNQATDQQEQKPQERRYSLEELFKLVGAYTREMRQKYPDAWYAMDATTDFLDWLRLREQEAAGKVTELLTPKNRLGEVIGKWPGDESDEQFNEMLKDNK